jgi:hypothetical protein
VDPVPEAVMLPLAVEAPKLVVVIANQYLLVAGFPLGPLEFNAFMLDWRVALMIHPVTVVPSKEGCSHTLPASHTPHEMEAAVRTGMKVKRNLFSVFFMT